MDSIEKEIEISIIDYLVIIVKNKLYLIGTTLFCMILFYLAIFFFVEEQFESSAVIVPSQESSISGLAGMLGNLGDLPFGLGGSSSSPEVGLYNTIFTSRTTIETVIEKYNLWEVYKLDKTIPKDVKNARETLIESINAEETEDGAYVLAITTPDPQLSADITNFLIDYLNTKVIDLKVEKSRNNRIFLEQRLTDIRLRLRESEDSLRYYQEITGILNPEEQVKGLISAYSNLEQELLIKQIQKDVLKNIYGKDSPQAKNITNEVDLFEKKLLELKTKGKKSSIFTPIETIPEIAIDYIRYYREVEINSTILQFILPLYEQAKIEEQKELPILQVIDNAIPAEEKSFPPRTILTLVVGMGIFLILSIALFFKENSKFKEDEKIQYIKQNMFKWKSL